MKLHIWLPLLLVLPLALSATGISVSSETPDELILEFQLPEYSIEHSRDGSTTWQRIVSDYGNVDAQEGYPELRAYSEAIAVPVDGDISIQVLSSKSSVIKNINLYPAKKMVVGDWEVDYEFFQDPRIYNSKQLYPESIASKSEAAFIGDRRFIPIRINPFQYRPALKELTVHSSIRIRVSIIGDKSQAKNWQFSQNPIDNVADRFFLNNASSKAWRLEKTRDSSYQSPKNGSSQVSRIQLIVDKDGIYKVDKAFLQNLISTETDSLGLTMAWDLSALDPRRLELSDENGTVPIHFVGETDGAFNSGDYFEFYGRRHAGDTGYMDDYTAENVYTLYLKDTLGARMAVENGGLIEYSSGNYISPDAYEYTAIFQEQSVSDKLGRGWSAANPTYYKEDVWFWKKISAPNLEIVPIELQFPIDSTIRTASAKVALHGLTYSETLIPGQWDHEASVRLNQAMINTHTWVGQTEQVFQNANPIPNSFIRNGTNNLFISLSGNTVMGDREQVLLDYVEVKYWRQYKTTEDFIKFTKPSNRPGGLYQFALEGFSSGDISVYKIGSSVFNSVQIESFDLNGMAPWTVTMQDSVASTAIEYYACTESQKMIPKLARLDIPSDLRDPSNQAEIIVISRRDLLNSEGGTRIKDLYESKGYTVMMVDIQDVFDEFNSGIRDAQSIKSLLSYAYNNWAEPQLRHVLLLGEGVDDERDNSPSRQYAVIPVKKTWTYKHGATASDNWYACIVGNDTVPDISIARVGVWRTDQIPAVVTKMENYHNNPLPNRLWNSHLTFTSGGKITDSNDIFAQQSERIKRRNVSDDYRVTRVYTSTQTVSPDYFGGTFALKDAINSGTQYVQFMGHGGGRIWADYNLFNFNDVATLNNQTYPIVVSLACYASAFDTNCSASISEALIMQADKGSIATLGFSGLGYLDQDEDWGLALTEALFKEDFPSAGEAVQFALARFFTTTTSTAARYALTNGASYMGDPTIKPRKPVRDAQVGAVSHVLAHGDTLRVNAVFPSTVTAARLYIMKENEKVINVPFDLPVINGNYNASYVVPATGEDPYTRKIYVAGYSSQNEYVGVSAFGVGRPAVFHHAIEPATPAWRDSVAFMARAFSSTPILSMTCKVRTDSVGTTINWVDLPMQLTDPDNNTWTTTGRLDPQITGKEVFYKYSISTQDSTGTVVYESFLSNLVYAGPDLFLRDIKLDNEDGEFALKVLVSNVGNAESADTDLRLYVSINGANQTQFSTQVLGPLAVEEMRWESIPLAGLPSGNVNFEVRANWGNSFPEWHLFYNTNNIITLTLPYNYHSVDSNGLVIPSVDANVLCEIPADLVPSGSSAVFYVNSVGTLTASNQPDIHPIILLSSDGAANPVSSLAYEIKTLNEALVDSTGTFVGGKRMKLTFFYSALDQTTQSQEAENSYKIYRWDASGRKWILQGGNISASEDRVVFEVRRHGIYTIFRNRDLIRPTIDVNVQDQEFTIGGYVSGKGTISLLLSDANGIDVFDNSIKLYLNGTQVQDNEYVASINLDNINRIPIKYQLNLQRGNYTLVVDCKDVNGNFNTREIQFIVNETFNITKIGNYPNPILGRAEDPKNDGRTRFTYVLTDDADQVTIKVYTVAGRLVKTFTNLPTGVGYHEYPRTLYAWDCKDEAGFPLANGVYFYKVIARKGNKTIEKTMKMAILK